LQNRLRRQPGEGHDRKLWIDAEIGREDRGIDHVEVAQIVGLEVRRDHGCAGIGTHAAGTEVVGGDQSELLGAQRLAIEDRELVGGAQGRRQTVNPQQHLARSGGEVDLAAKAQAAGEPLDVPVGERVTDQ